MKPTKPMTKAEKLEFAEMIRRRDFTTDEAIEISGADRFTFRNWLKRGTLDIGEKHRVGRWLFSPLDMIITSAMVDLVQVIGMQPTMAKPAAEDTANLLKAFVKLSIQKQQKPDEEVTVLTRPLEDHFILISIHDGKPKLWRLVADVDGVLATENGDTETAMPVQRISHVRLAAGLIIEDVIDKVRDKLAERENE